MSSPSLNNPTARPVNPLLAETRALLASIGAFTDDGPRTAAARKAPRCQHVKSKGYRCGSPALRGREFCFYHDRIRNRRFEDGLPALDDANSIQLAVMQVLDGLHRGKVDAETARVYLYGLRIAAQVDENVLVPDPDRVVLEEPGSSNGVTEKIPALAASAAAAPRR